jgi:hypothetical protein
VLAQRPSPRTGTTRVCVTSFLGLGFDVIAVDPPKVVGRNVDAVQACFHTGFGPHQVQGGAIRTRARSSDDPIAPVCRIPVNSIR